MIFQTETLTGVAERKAPASPRMPNTSAQLIHLLSDHAKRESSALGGYARLAESSESDGIRYLARMIIEDEQRHHQMLADMLNLVHSQNEDIDLEPRAPGAISVDEVAFEATELLLAAEREDERELRRLRKELRHEPSGSLLPLLVDLMLTDTGKHIHILEFVADQQR
jgi:rubrerythrin